MGRWGGCYMDNQRSCFCPGLAQPYLGCIISVTVELTLAICRTSRIQQKRCKKGGLLTDLTNIYMDSHHMASCAGFRNRADGVKGSGQTVLMEESLLLAPWRCGHAFGPCGHLRWLWPDWTPRRTWRVSVPEPPAHLWELLGLLGERGLME